MTGRVGRTPDRGSIGDTLEEEGPRLCFIRCAMMCKRQSADASDLHAGARGKGHHGVVALETEWRFCLGRATMSGRA